MSKPPNRAGSKLSTPLGFCSWKDLEEWGAHVDIFESTPKLLGGR